MRNLPLPIGHPDPALGYWDKARNLSAQSEQAVAVKNMTYSCDRLMLPAQYNILDA
jgi:hypothetical protein